MRAAGRRIPVGRRAGRLRSAGRFAVSRPEPVPLTLDGPRGVPARVVSLRDGTMAWHLAGFKDVSGATGRAPEMSSEGIAAAQPRADAVARRYHVPLIDRARLAEWQREADRRTLYVVLRNRRMVSQRFWFCAATYSSRPATRISNNTWRS
ncbi:MAG: hypothetical protein J2P48_11940 [Alphaproteobacteria bacterium]|nr:hypothetical protein [Alphaproteobacteria bacterium]